MLFLTWHGNIRELSVLPVYDKYFFKTEYEYRILFGFQKSLKTEYRILFGIKKLFEYQILNSKKDKIYIFFLYKTNSVMWAFKCCSSSHAMVTSGNSGYSQSVTNTFLRPNTNNKYYSVFRNHWRPNTKYYSGLRKSEYRIWIVVFGPTILIPNT